VVEHRSHLRTDVHLLVVVKQAQQARAVKPAEVVKQARLVKYDGLVAMAVLRGRTIQVRHLILLSTAATWLSDRLV
jgi:hypothetical protein